MDPASRFKRANTSKDVDKVTEIITTAFEGDPTWAPLLYQGGTHETARRYWRLFVNAAARHGWNFSNEEGSAASVWYPPGASELSEQEEAGFSEFATNLLGEEVAQTLFATGKAFEAATPEGDFFYLSLLAVNPEHSGKGIGMQLLRQNLQEIDELGVPTYLESSNPANDVKYERLGYVRHGRFTVPSGLQISTFWREPTA